MLEDIKFDFGRVKYTVRAAGLLFLYQINFSAEGVYIIALSEQCGAITFRIPDETVEAINKRVAALPVTFDKYLFRLVDKMAAFRQVADAAAGFGIGCDAAGEALVNLARAGQSAGILEDLEELEESLPFPDPPANNWLKAHGKPMRRKKKGVKR